MKSTAVPASLEALLAHRTWVRRVARALTADEHLAADIEQDFWVEALERPPRVRTSVRAWIRTVLRHDLLDRVRAESRRARREEIVSRPEAIPSDEEVIADADAHRRVVNAVMDLAEPYRATVLLRWHEDLGPSAIAARQGVPVATVRTRLKRAIHLLRERFDSESGGDRSAWMSALAPFVHGRDLVGGTAAGSTTAAKVAGGIAVKTTTKLGIAALVLFLGIGIGWELGGATAAPARPVTESATAAGPQHASTDMAAADSEQAEDQSASRIAQSAESADAAAGDASRTSGAPANAGRSGAAAAPAVVAMKPQPPIPPDLPDGPAGQAEVVGRVLLAPDRTPVGGAVVAWRRGSVTTGRNGVFRIVGSPGPALLTASLEGHAPREVRVSVPTSGGVGGVDFVFGDGGALEGRLVGSDGAAVDAEVFINAGATDLSRTTCLTDADGRWRFDDVPSGRRIWVGLTVGDLLALKPTSSAHRGRWADVVAGRTTRVDFDLGDRMTQASLAGHVTDHGVPVAGVFLQVSSGWFTVEDAIGSSKTDDAGGFRIDGLRTGESSVRLQFFGAAGVGRQESVAVKRLTLVPGENRVEIALGEGDLAGEVSGRTLRKSSGSSITMVELRLYALDERAPGAWVARTRVAHATEQCGSDGSYAFHGLPPGRYRLVAEPSGRVDVREAAVDFDLANGERKTKLDVSMEDAKPRNPPISVATLSGAVVDAAGGPVTHAGVDVYAADSDARTGASIDSRGRYSDVRVRPGRCRVFYSCTDYECEVAETTIVLGPNAQDLRLGAGEVTGRVRTRADDRGLWKLDVNLTASAVQPDGTLRYVGLARARQDGTFRFGGLPDGKFRIVAWPLVEGLRPASADVEVMAGRAVAGVDLALDIGDAGAAVLVVRDGAGEEVKWVRVEAVADGRPVPGSRANLFSLTGNFVVPVAPGQWTFTLWTDDGLLAGTAACNVLAGAAVRADVVLGPRKSEESPR